MLTFFHRHIIHDALSLNNGQHQERILLFQFHPAFHINLKYPVIVAGIQLVHPVLGQIQHRPDALLCGLCRNGDDIQTLFNVKFPRTAVLQSVIIVDAVGNIAVLLRLKQ